MSGCCGVGEGWMGGWMVDAVKDGEDLDSVFPADLFLIALKPRLVVGNIGRSQHSGTFGQLIVT